MSSEGSPFLRVDVGRLTTAAIVIGAGVVIGVSGLYVFFSRQQQRQLAHLTRTIEGLRKDVGELKLVAGTNDCNFSSAKKLGQSLHRTPQAFNQHKVHADTTSRTTSIADENGTELYFDVSDDENYNTDFTNSTTRDNDVGLADADDECRSSAAVTSTIDFEAIDLLLAGNDVDNELAYSKLVSNKAQGMADPEFVWRLVRACYLCFLNAGRLGDAERQKDLIAEGMEYSIAGLAIDNDHPDLHKYAVLLGRSTDFLGIQDKIKNGFKFKEHLDQAIRLRPDDRTLYFMKGRWCYEVAMLSWVERKVAATLFATPPTSTLDEARQQFLKVEELFPLKWKENLLYIAKCLIGEGNYAEAMKWLNKSANLDCQTPDEEVIEVEIKQLLSKYRKYDA